MIFHVAHNHLQELEDLWQEYSILYKRNKAKPTKATAKHIQEVKAQMVARQEALVQVIQSYQFHTL